MPVHGFDLAILLRNLDDDVFLAEALLFPEVSRFGDDPEKLKRAVISLSCAAIAESHREGSRDLAGAASQSQSRFARHADYD